MKFAKLLHKSHISHSLVEEQTIVQLRGVGLVVPPGAVLRRCYLAAKGEQP